ncbi:MAG: O-antigen ligase family protein [Planctomycetota bacterium]
MDRRPKTAAGKMLVGLSCAAVILFAAFDRGGAYDWTKFFVTVFVTILAILALITGDRRSKFLPAVAWISCLVWLVGLCQTVPLPASIVNWISPQSVAAYREWIPAEVYALSSSGRTPEWVPISVAPGLTRRALGSLALFGVAVWLTGFWCRAPIAVFAFKATMVVGAAVLAVWGISGQPSSSFGPFVNNNNAGSFLNLAVACGFGAIVFLRRCQFEQRPRLILAGILWIAVSVTLVGLLATNSRGAFLGLLAGGLGMSAVVVHSYMRSRAAWMIGCTVSLAWIALIGLGLWSRLVSRVESLWTAEAMSDPRVTHWQDGIQASVQYFPAGAGLGTYRYAHLPFQESGSNSWFVHADGMPVEWLLEGGLWVLPCVVLTLVLIARSVFVVGASRHNGEANRRAVKDSFIIATVYGVPALVVTQCFDYGILQPPSFLLFACLLGGLSWTAYDNEHDAESSPIPSDSWSRLRHRAFGVFSRGVLLSMLCLALFDFFVASEVERVSQERRGWMSLPIGETPSRQTQLATLKRLVELKPSDAATRLLLANVMLDEQRRIGARYLASNDVDPKQAAAMVSLRSYRRAVSTAETPGSLEKILLPGQDAEQWRTARNHVLEALIHSPYNDECRVLLVELESVSPETTALSENFLEQLKILRVGNRSALRFYKRM